MALGSSAKALRRRATTHPWLSPPTKWSRCHEARSLSRRWQGYRPMSDRRRLKTAPWALTLLLAQAAPVFAQSLLDPAPAATVRQPGILPGESESILASRPAPVKEEEKARALVPFEQSATAFRLSGEDDVARLSFYLAPE